MMETDLARDRALPVSATVVSVNVGGIRTVRLGDRDVPTGIWKSPVAGPVRISGVNLDGDDQADRSVHGGPDKAVYAYASEDLAWWAGEIGRPVTPGTFGENLTTLGIDLAASVIGERWAVGSAVLEVTQPRVPCFKLGLRFGRPELVKLFLRAGRSGFYLSVLREGELGAGDAIERIPVATPSLSVAEVAALYAGRVTDRARMRLASELAGLPQGWRDGFREALERSAPA
jgi:MOSC domain-containing protein YiiM